MHRTPHEIEDAILEHLHEVAVIKRALLQVASTISPDFPSEAGVTLHCLAALTKSADKLLGDTVVSELP